MRPQQLRWRSVAQREPNVRRSASQASMKKPKKKMQRKPTFAHMSCVQQGAGARAGSARNAL